MKETVVKVWILLRVHKEMCMLKIHLFGSGSANYHDRALAGFPGQQAGLIMCYLILNHSQPIPRERLAAVFWEDLPTVTARKYLRNAFWRMKRMLDDSGVDTDQFLSITDEFVSLNDVENTWIDVQIFRTAYSDCMKSMPESLSAIQVQALEEAVHLYTGDLLHGIYEDWTLHDREQLRLMYISMRQKLMMHHNIYNRFEEALHHGEKILALAPAREKIHRQMMRMYASNGDRSAALAQYKRCKQILKDELSIGPMKQTRVLYREIRDNQFDQNKPITDEAAPATPNALRKLHKLQRLADRIHSELQTLEKLLNHNPVDAD
jgi:DNA-binding SARP family transcriptional activator